MVYIITCHTELFLYVKICLNSICHVNQEMLLEVQQSSINVNEKRKKTSYCN